MAAERSSRQNGRGLVQVPLSNAPSNAIPDLTNKAERKSRRSVVITSAGPSAYLGSKGVMEMQSKVIVLVVEDEPILRMMGVHLVEEAGFEAMEAGNADRAVEILESRSDVRIVFTDIDMPGSMDGMKLAAAVRNRWPPIEIILTSGYYDLKKSELPARSVFFRKPYNNDEIIETLQRMAA